MVPYLPVPLLLSCFTSMTVPRPHTHMGLHCSCPDSCPVAPCREPDRAAGRGPSPSPRQMAAPFLTAGGGYPPPGSLGRAAWTFRPSQDPPALPA